MAYAWRMSALFSLRATAPRSPRKARSLPPRRRRKAAWAIACSAGARPATQGSEGEVTSGRKSPSWRSKRAQKSLKVWAPALRGHVWKWSSTAWMIPRTSCSGAQHRASQPGSRDVASFWRKSRAGLRMSWSVVRIAEAQSCVSTGSCGAWKSSSPTLAARLERSSSTGIRSSAAQPAWACLIVSWQTPSSAGKTCVRASSGLAARTATADSGANWPSPQHATANSTRCNPSSGPPVRASFAALAM
mmetsp:Transcript_71938/g.232752  ORF Transcript_71938/g.232752 Transcript_71938/m.232752 type:complete len:246 (+) Transcript_71938:104-841(+)